MSSGSPAEAGPLPPAWRRVALLVLLVVAAWFLARVAVPSARRLTAGFGAYYTASKLLLEGPLEPRVYEDAYFRPLVGQALLGREDDIFNANPPTCALMFLPLAKLPVRAARWLWTLLSVGFLGLGLLVLSRAFAGPDWRRLLGPALLLGLLFRPVHASFAMGQAYVLLFLLFALATAALVRARDGLSAGALAAAALFKSAGLALPLAAAAARRWRLVALTAATGAAVILASLWLFPPATWQAYLRLLREVVSAPYLSVTVYQTTRSLLTRLFVPDPRWNPHPLVAWPGLAAVLVPLVGAASLGVTLWLARRRADAGFVAMIAWGILMAPLGEQHHHTALLVPLVWLVAEALAGRLVRGPALFALGGAVLLYVVPFPLNHPALKDGWRALLAYPRLYAGWLTWLAVTLHALGGPGAAPEPVPEQAERG